MLPNKGSSFIVSEHSIQYDINKKSRLKTKNAGTELASLDVKMQNTDSMYHMPVNAHEEDLKKAKKQ